MPYVFYENFGNIESGGTNSPFNKRIVAAATLVSGDVAIAKSQVYYEKSTNFILAYNVVCACANKNTPTLLTIKL